MFPSLFHLAMGLGPTELIVILVVVLIVIGPGKLPQVGKGLGSFISNFKKEVKSLEDDLDPDK